MYTSVEAVYAVVNSARLKQFLPAFEDDDALETFLAEKIAVAEAEMDAYFTKMYSLPLDVSSLTDEQQTNINALLSAWAIALVVYLVVSQSGTDVPKGIQIAYDRTRSRLMEIQKRTYKLPYFSVTFGPKLAVVGDRENQLTQELFNRSRAI